MKKVIFQSFSEKADRPLMQVLHKIWLFFAKCDSKVSREVAKIVFPSLAESAASFYPNYQHAKARYDSKQQQLLQAQQQAMLAYESGNKSAGNLAMGKAIAIKLILLELEQKIRQAEQVLKSDRQAIVSSKVYKY